ncbi:class I SAM-dependent methyltransferase [Conexibacter sp. DBS9H8]|uniref:class I SAM-dependent methyltransferase n=1 Tax=Conexibacter sp. DBS9H8 TaxID=2937801 RepID=UPI0020102F90|nr:class I SAM-dependent methyltransferase [Conexibacter sp. DBS9H8]
MSSPADPGESTPAVADRPGGVPLADQVAAISWYHTLELPGGVVTPGFFDHRSILPRVPLPADLQGRRCLDVGTFNGFWAFELERRGAAEVVAVDVLDPRRWDWPVGAEAATRAAVGERHAGGDGFRIAAQTLGSTVTREDVSVYDLDPARVGRFDLIFLGSLLVHLREPVRALEAVASVLHPGGTLVLVDGIDLPLTLSHPRTPVARLDGRGRPWWWTANAAGLARMLEVAGFTVERGPERLFVPPGAGWRLNRWDWRLARSREGRYHLIVAWRGDPHAAIVARR